MQLDKEVITGSKFSYTAILSNVLNKTVLKPVIRISAAAYLKMFGLVQAYTTEVGWHGTVRKQGNIYFIDDILVYPQEVSAATVTTDDLEYSKWLMDLSDPIFEHLRFQGHSHVNMGTTPSGVDSNFYESLLCNLKQDDYYIFAIMNKRNELNIWVYDYPQNTIFEKEDITWEVMLGPNKNLGSWLSKSEKSVANKKYTAWNQKDNSIATTGMAPAKPKPKSTGLIQGEYESDLEFAHRYWDSVDPDTAPARRPKGGKKHGSK